MHKDKVITTIYLRKEIRDTVRNKNLNLSELINDLLERHLFYVSFLPTDMQKEIEGLNENLDNLKKSFEKQKEIFEKMIVLLTEMEKIQDSLEKNFFLARNKIDDMFRSLARKEEKEKVELYKEWNSLRKEYLTRRQIGIPEEADIGWITSPKLAPILRKLKLSPEEALQKLREEVSVSDTTQQ